MTAHLKVLKPQSQAEKVTMTTTDTIEVSPEIVNSWQLPPFQRPLRVNTKVQALAEDIKRDGGVIPGTLTIGILDKTQYLIDGQHRREAFLLSGCSDGYVDVRFQYFDSMADMGNEFVNLNSRLVSMKPDDILRGLEGTMPTLAKIRKRCPFVGYDQIRRGDKAPVVSMSAVIRCWFASSSDVPSAGGSSALNVAKDLSMEETELLVSFLDLAFQAWGRDNSYHRLWLNLNLTLCMWLYRGMVISQYSTRTQKISRELFGKCLMSVSADSTYLDWLLGRQLSERDRSPAYNRVKAIFARRIEDETGKKPLMPSPAWVSHSSSAGGRR